MKNENILKEYKILAILGIPFFAVKTDEEKAELQTVVKLKLKEITELTVIPEPDLSQSEEYLNQLDSKFRELRAQKATIINRIEKFKCRVAYIIIFMHYFIRHLIIRIRFKKQICKEEIKMFAETASETIEEGRERRIKKLAGIE